MVLSSLSKVGLSAFPSAMTAAITSRVLPAVLFGVKIWGIKEAVDMMIKRCPYLSSTLMPVMRELKIFCLSCKILLMLPYITYLV